MILDRNKKKVIKLSTPLREKDIGKLYVGDKVLLEGVIYTARDAAHKRLVKLLKEGKDLPFELKGNLLYYVGPTPAREGKVIGAAGPTTSYRMDAYAPKLIAEGLKGMIGKGPRSEEVVRTMKKYKSVYFAAIGGAGALIAKSIKKADIIAYEDLGPEAIYKLEVKDFFMIVVNDIYGGDLYKEQLKKYKEVGC